ncbi:MAG: TIGR04076 family protein [Clostridiales bacterium]|nr:TIGR04076 family protein [Clostridiales bacterium]
MKKCRITVMRVAAYQDLMAHYENPLPNACDMEEGQVFVANAWQKPAGFCDSAWESLSPFVMTLACGGEDIYSGWMKDKKSAMISCNDGFRPVSFLIEALDEDADSI